MLAFDRFVAVVSRRKDLGLNQNCCGRRIKAVYICFTALCFQVKMLCYILLYIRSAHGAFLRLRIWLSAVNGGVP